MEPVICGWCGGVTRPIFMGGHYECGRCHSPVVDCCDGERKELETTAKDLSVTE